MKIFNGKSLTAKVIAEILLAWYDAHRQVDDSHNDFYCGIAEDPEDRISEHETKDHGGREITISVAYECDSMEVAAEVEEIMHRTNGFDWGKTEQVANGATERSRFVYLYRKP